MRKSLVTWYKEKLRGYLKRHAQMCCARRAKRRSWIRFFEEDSFQVKQYGGSQQSFHQSHQLRVALSSGKVGTRFCWCELRGRMEV